ncbi:MAG TPA: hypothetical protein VGG72_36010 [Bryobacteraceae bacterium]|jgi:hypothetical protein
MRVSIHLASEPFRRDRPVLVGSGVRHWLLGLRGGLIGFMEASPL